MEKNLKNANQFSVKLSKEDAERLRSVGEATGISHTTIIRNAIRKYLPYMERFAEELKGSVVNNVR